jgi:hypothetical protein
MAPVCWVRRSKFVRRPGGGSGESYRCARAEKLRSFRANGLVTKRRPFGRAGHNTDVVGHELILKRRPVYRHCPEIRMLKQIVIVLFVGGFVAAQIKRPERRVVANVITSDQDPKVRIQLPKAVQYVGADRWVLYGIADCELHAFVEADEQKNVQRLYWVQFEGYVPSRPELKHEYNSPQHAKIGGMDFYVDTWVRKNDGKTRPGSDTEHIEALIREKGYRMPAGMMDVRLVHLLDEQMRKELMIIYGEDVTPTGFSAADLDKGGKAHDRWPAIEKALVERSVKKIAIEEIAKQ